MAQILVDGARNAVLKFDAAETFDVSTLEGAPERVRIMKIWYDVGAGTDHVIEWKATVDVPAFHMSGRHFMDFTCFGGITNNAGAGVTGDFEVAGTTPFTVIVHLEK
jgi:hypothetical protein